MPWTGWFVGPRPRKPRRFEKGVCNQLIARASSSAAQFHRVSKGGRPNIAVTRGNLSSPPLHSPRDGRQRHWSRVAGHPTRAGKSRKTVGKPTSGE